MLKIVSNNNIINPWRELKFKTSTVKIYKNDNQKAAEQKNDNQKVKTLKNFNFYLKKSQI